MRLWPALAIASLVAMPATATTFFDDFEDETAGGTILNYSGFANWTVSDGTVDLIRSGEFGITCRTGNYCVDLDGSTGDAGVLTLSAPIAIGPGDVVDIVSWISGNQRGGGNDSVDIRLILKPEVPVTGFQFLTESGYTLPVDFPGGLGLAIIPRSIEPGAPFTNFGFRFTAGGATTLTLQFLPLDGDNIGAILDDVSIRVTPAIPEPATWAMLIAGFGLVGAAARRRRLAAA